MEKIQEITELRLDLAEEKPREEYKYMQSQMLDYLELFKPRQAYNNLACHV